MKFFKKKKADIETPLEPKISIPEPEHPAGTRRLVRIWDKDLARYAYELQRYERSAMWFGPADYWYWATESQGDLEWAQRTADHYGLTVEDVDKGKVREI
ncbi:hypothetical protein AHiyo8_58840 [Arthrobacter sp. Hiyo8]|uniref:hypothetical protein n=1 Tax=Arthrobacter sp. Hiyo1 TaxID=1588020 RepID=UPI00068384AB|nr:hypothetical protein [Arthrobacter sp. Hiyo1]BAS17581.1 hypothetical protein AHiyo8_58840 [Arthrobacter sp. Hiyo8]GAP57940.1 hypothetical protein AHiyo1_09020 [Arthrobacter sp. Hiyo1]